jgi:hypothetical protein
MRAFLLIFLASQIGCVNLAFATALIEPSTREERMTEGLKNFRQSEYGSHNVQPEVSGPAKAKCHHMKHPASKHHPKFPSVAGLSQ